VGRKALKKNFQKKMPAKIVAYLPFILTCLLLFYLSSQSGWPFVLPKFPHLDKLLHFLAYGVLGMFSAYASIVRRGKFKRKAFIEGWFLAATYGFIDELHQSYVPFRSSSYGDALADCAGALAGVVAVYFIGKHLGNIPVLFRKNIVLNQKDT
jgi:hypothetical protein